MTPILKIASKQHGHSLDSISVLDPYAKDAFKETNHIIKYFGKQFGILKKESSYF